MPQFEKEEIEGGDRNNMKPPSLRKAESSSSGSLSSYDVNKNNSSSNNSNKNRHFTPANLQESRKLVDYFVVFSSKPRLKYKKKKKKPKETEEELKFDDDIASDFHPETPPRTFCCKKKPNLTEGKNKSSIKKKLFRKKKKKKKKDSKKQKKDDIKPPPKTKRPSLRDVHLTDNMEDIDFLDKSNDTEISDIVSPDDGTPVISHHKATKGKGRRKKNQDTMNKSNNRLSKLLKPPSHTKRDKVPTMIRESSFAIPVTAGSYASDFDSDYEMDRTLKKQKEYEKKIPNISKLSLKNENQDDGEENKEEEAMTPSRMRATQESNLDAISHEEDNNGTKLNNEGAEGGPSENIHLPSENGFTEDKKNGDNVYLVPVLTAKYPQQDHSESPLNPMISQFCFPHGETIQFTTEYIMPRIHFFVLTNDRGKKMYGTCLTVYEEFDLEGNSEIDEEDLQHFCRNDDVNIESTDSEDSIEVSLDNSEKIPTLYHPKVICILSSWPYLNAFREYLSQFYRLATMTNMMTCPIERFVLNICEEVPAPPPGMFEIRLKILNSTIRFWAPPANQPIPYVSIPFNVLFECLDINNILFVWYALTLEHKVLLVSCQSSLLTLCAEILCALLFPMEWSHLYIPILPMFLSPMLDAPFPYLCGITRANFNQAIDNISQETIVVDLDQNLITRGEHMPPFPPMPLRRRTKLETILKKSVGDIFWNVRGVTKTEVEFFEENEGQPSTGISKTPTTDMNKTLRIWKEKLYSYDDAFNLAFTPDSENIMNEERSHGIVHEFVQSKWDCVQEAFLGFFSTMLRDHKRFISINGNNRSFRMNQFLNAQRTDYKPFLKALAQTQHFDCYITKAMYTPEEPEVIFFDQSIAAKRNRSKMSLKKKRTPFLLSAKAQKQLRVVDAAKPSDESETHFSILDKIYASSPEKKTFFYSRWPESFDPKLLKNPKKIPDVVAAEFDKRSSSKEDQDETIELQNFHLTEVNYSIEVTTFTLFFILCCELIGDKLESIRDQYLIQGENLMGEDAVRGNNFPDCRNICTFGKSASDATVDKEFTTSYKDFALNKMQDNQLADFASNRLDSEIETARIFAFAELDLAFSALETLFVRKLKPDVDALKALMAACGRCNCANRATKLMTLIEEKGIHVDSETYYYFCINAPLDGHKGRKDWSAIRMKALNRKKENKKKQNKKKTADEYLDGSENSSFSGTGSFQDSMSLTSSNISRSRLPPRATPTKKRKWLKPKGNLEVTTQVEKHIDIGETLLKYLYSDLEIITNDVTCRHCGTSLNEDQVRLGWNFSSFTDNTTTCPFCKNSFVPSFIVKTSDKDFFGSQGRGTPLHCDFISPWVLHKEIHAATRENTFKNILDPRWRRNGDRNSVIWWNLVITFQRQNLPITFLLQGSFRERLIMPMPMSD